MEKFLMDRICECGGILKKSMTDFKGTKEIPCWKCTKCGTEFFDAEQVKVLDEYLTDMIDQQLSNPLDDED
jgi:hypothetical protein